MESANMEQSIMTWQLRASPVTPVRFRGQRVHVKRDDVFHLAGNKVALPQCQCRVHQRCETYVLSSRCENSTGFSSKATPSSTVYASISQCPSYRLPASS
jgi:hypothetical protein